MPSNKSCFFHSVAEQYPHIKIWDDLLKNYDRRVKPVRDPNTAINLKLGLMIENIIKLVSLGLHISLILLSKLNKKRKTKV